MGDSALHDIKQLLQDVLSKVAVLEGKMVIVEDGMKPVGTKVSAVDGEIAAVKADQGRLHVAINTVQSKQIEAVVTSGTSARDAPASFIGGAVLNAASHKLRFPKYDGSGDPLPWLHRCDQFFQAARTAEVEKVWLAAFYMEGIAQQWYYRLERNRQDSNQGDPSWSQFCELVNQRFGPPTCSNPLGELCHLRCTGSINDYQAEFLTLLAYYGGVSEPQQIAIFTAGLEDPLRIDVELQKPLTLEEVAALARAYERRLTCDTGGRTVPPGGRTSMSSPASQTTAPCTTSGAPSAATPTAAATALPAAPRPPRPALSSRLTRLTPDEMAHRREAGLCFNCPEKFSRDHLKQCSMRGIYLLEMGDEWSPKGADVPEEMEVSLHAITGVSTGNTMQLAMQVAHHTIAALVDSGSTHCFVASAMAQRLGWLPQPRHGMTVGVANGDHISCVGFCPGADVFIGQEEFIIDFYIVSLAGYEMVLGCQWLRTLRPVLWDFATHAMSFWRFDHPVQWHGIATASTSHLHSATADNVLQCLLDEFADVFATPTSLPPSRPVDHRIHLLPGTAPIAVRPYRYPQLLKDEIKHQCSDMLAQGLIRPSTSPFSAPVLLVKKKDGTWRFCVDYRALNAKAVKDKFPIPIVEELLDELNGACYFTKMNLRSGYHQVRMHPEDVAKTAFRTHHGDFEFRVMAFGLTNAPPTLP
jgi:hypothetical protein